MNIELERFLSRSSHVLVIGLSLTDYGPLVQGFMLLAEIASYCKIKGIKLEVIGSEKFSTDFISFYDLTLFNYSRLQLRQLIRFSRISLLCRVLFSSILLPILKPKSSLIYLDDTGCIIPFRRSLVFIHSPLSAYSWIYLYCSQVKIGFYRHLIQRLYLFFIAHISRNLFFVQSSFVASQLTRQIYLDTSSVFIFDVMASAMHWHPLLGTSSKSLITNSFHLVNVVLHCPIKSKSYSIFELGFKHIVFSCSSPRPQKNPLFIVQVARECPSIAFVTTLPLSFFKFDPLPPNLFPIGPQEHEVCLRWMAIDFVNLTFFPSMMETYGLPIIESVILEKHCLIPDEPFFEVHTYPHITRYRTGDCADAVKKILSITISSLI